MRIKRALPLMILGLFASALFAGASVPPQAPKEAEHNRKGMQYYSEAFYQHLPKGKQREADESFDLAVSEFKQALAANPRYADAYRNLARLYYVRKDFRQAAEAYRNLTNLEPQDIDAYLQLALSYTELDRFAEAIQALETAKRQTDDPEAKGKLDGYIAKLKQGKGGPDHD
jgi:tetratricopeptide (TPR) repeat protein